jgi:aspartokinase
MCRLQPLRAHIQDCMKVVRELVEGVYLLREATIRSRDAIASFGELLSAPLLAAELQCEWLDARQVSIRSRNRVRACVSDCELADQNKRQIR